MCVCCDIYIYIRVCEVKIFLPLKKGTIERKTQTRVRFTLSLSPSLFLSGLFRSLCPNLSLFSLVRKKKRKKKSNQISFRKSVDFSKNPTTFCFSRYYYYVELFSLCAYTRKRGLEKREKTSAYKSNNNNKREREKERTVLIIRRIDEAEKSRAYTNDDDDGSSSRRL